MINALALSLAVKAGLVQASDKQLVIDANWENLEEFTNLLINECAGACMKEADKYNALHKEDPGMNFISYATGCMCAETAVLKEFGLDK